MNKTELSKPLSVSTKYQITVPEHVRELMEIKANDKVIFTTDGENVFFEKYLSKEENHLKLVTYARSLLKTGAPIFISGATCTGKSKLAKEIGSYGFEQVVYINPPISPKDNDYSDLTKKFTYAMDTFRHPSELLIIDEYTFLESSKLVNLDEKFFENFKGSLIVVTLKQDSIPIPPFYSHSVSYNIHLDDLVKDTRYTVIQHITDNAQRSSDKTIATMIPVNYELPNAITSWSAIEHFKKLVTEMDMEAFFKDQQLAAIKYIEKYLYSNDILTINKMQFYINAAQFTNSVSVDLSGLKMILIDYLIDSNQQTEYQTIGSPVGQTLGTGLGTSRGNIKGQDLGNKK